MPSVRFSLTGSTGMGWSKFKEAAITAEDLGFYGFFPSDHLLLPGRADSDDYLDSLTGIAALAAYTSKLRLGVMVAGNIFRHPVILTKIATTIDHASNGRMELGIGAAWAQEECEVYGIPFPPPAVRVSMLRDAVKVIKGLWTNEVTTLDSEHYPLRKAPLYPKPVQIPHPPLIIGGGGNTTMKIAAEFADEWNYIGPITGAKERQGKIDSLCEQFERAPGSLRRSTVINLHIASSSSEKEKLQTQVAQRMRTIASASKELLSLPDAELAKQSSLIGSVEEVSDQINDWAELGIGHISFFTPRPFDRNLLEKFSKSVMPEFA